jgi:cytochrome P450
VVGGEIAAWEHLPELDLTARVILEAMRLYPPSWIIPRMATRETRLGGHVIPAGTVMLYSQYVLHHHPGSFDEPDRFDPYRWPSRVPKINGVDRRKGHPMAPVRHAYVPFGGGATKCIGDQFATAEAVLALASIVARWKPTLSDPQLPVEPSARTVLALRSLPVRLTARRVAVPDGAARSR